MTNLQMIQFVGIFAHSMQLFLVPDCGFPVAYGFYIGAHGVMFFILFSQFYVAEYLKKQASRGKLLGVSSVLIDGLKKSNGENINF